MDDLDIVGSVNPSAGTLNETKTIKPQTIVINEKKDLYKSYMPYIRGGGLFISFNEETFNKVSPGDKVLILFSMLEDRRKTTIAGTVIWINKTGVNKGYGVAFTPNPQTKALKESIEANILDMTVRKEPTFTF